MSEEVSGEKTTLGFRLTDKQFLKELRRMKAFEVARRKLGGADTLDYRLGHEGFFFKICGKVTLQSESTKPIAGMYVPLSFMESLLDSDDIRGPKGGARITWDNVGRYIRNDLFVKLVQDGWVGTRRWRRIAGHSKCLVLLLN